MRYLNVLYVDVLNMKGFQVLDAFELLRVELLEFLELLVALQDPEDLLALQTRQLARVLDCEDLQIFQVLKVAARRT